jgi:molecular chaperone GrpE
MNEDQVLCQQFLDFIKSSPPPPDYWGTPPVSLPSEFDPYTLVAEWIALRHEVKQQGKLVQNAQSLLKKTLTEIEQQNLNPVPQVVATDLSEQTSGKELCRQLLTTLDALDGAEGHLQNQIQDVTLPPAPIAPRWQRYLKRWLGWAEPQGLTAATVLEILNSNQTGLALIRRSLLDLLAQHQVQPMMAEGSPFDPKFMYAMGRQSAPGLAENTVIQEVVKGYWWQDQVLREAQVIVAGK